MFSFAYSARNKENIFLRMSCFKNMTLTGFFSDTYGKMIMKLYSIEKIDLTELVKHSKLNSIILVILVVHHQSAI